MIFRIVHQTETFCQLEIGAGTVVELQTLIDTNKDVIQKMAGKFVSIITKPLPTTPAPVPALTWHLKPWLRFFSINGVIQIAPPEGIEKFTDPTKIKVVPPPPDKLELIQKVEVSDEFVDISVKIPQGYTTDELVIQFVYELRTKANVREFIGRIIRLSGPFLGVNAFAFGFVAANLAAKGIWLSTPGGGWTKVVGPDAPIKSIVRFQPGMQVEINENKGHLRKGSSVEVLNVGVGKLNVGEIDPSNWRERVTSWAPSKFFDATGWVNDPPEI